MTIPTILLVEDRESIRDQLALKLHDAGAHVLTAASADDAYITYQRRVSEIAALVTDIRLNESDPSDRSGVILAKRISNVSPKIPRFGVTAYDVTAGEGVLDEVYEKKLRRASRSIYRHMGSIVARAIEYDEHRYSSIPKELIALKEKYHISNSDFAQLVSSWRVSDLGRLALLEWHDVYDSKNPESDDEIAKNGFSGERQLRFVRIGTQVGVTGRTAADFAVVIRSTDEGILAQLFGMPLIFTYADNENEAVTSLVELLYECFKTMGDPSEFSRANNLTDVVRFRAFLDKVFTDKGVR